MKKSRIAVVGVALVAGLGAAYLASLREPAPAPPVPPVAEKIAATEVLVASTDLPLGMRIGAPNLKWLPWPAEGIGNGMIVNRDNPDAIARNAGSMVRESFVANEPIRQEKLVKSDNGFLAAILPGGKRALAITIDQRGSTTAGTLILPNDRVDIIRIYKDVRATRSQGVDVYLTETLLQNIRVLAIGPNIEEKNGERVAQGETATLELEPDQVNMVALAQRTGTLTLALRSVADAHAPEPERRLETATVTIVRGSVREEYAVLQDRDFGKSQIGKPQSGNSRVVKSETGKSESGKPESGKSESSKSQFGKFQDQQLPSLIAKISAR